LKGARKRAAGARAASVTSLSRGFQRARRHAADAGRHHQRASRPPVYYVRGGPFVDTVISHYWLEPVPASRRGWAAAGATARS
jgi:hypothetical protein